MNCPYCGSPNMPTPPKTKRPFGECPDCGKKSRASVSCGKNGEIYAHYSATSFPKLGDYDVKKVRTFRASDRELKMIENGKLKLVVSNGRITVAV